MEDEEIKLYDSQFSLYDIAKTQNTSKYKIANTTSTEIARNTSFGESIFDDDFFPNVQLNWGNEGDNLNELIDENRAQNQPWISKLGAGIGRIGAKVVSEIAKMPGVLGGVVAGTVGQIGDAISGEDNTDFIKTAFNNAWIQSITDVEEYAKSELLPVYVKKAVKEGNLWDNITSIDFWATEGADGIGYIVSMLAPGAAINKFGVGAKILGTNKYAQMAAKTKNADKAIKLLQKGAITSKNADLATSTFANTLFESAAEAKGAMDSYESHLQQKLDNGEISIQQYDKELKKSSEIGRNVFLANAAILVGPNAIMSKMLWGKTRNRTAGSLISDNKLQSLANPALKIKAGRVGKDFLYAGGREGLWEEGMQSTVESYYTENPDSNGFDIIGDLPKAYADMFTSTDGQKAMFLGALFGGGMQGYFGAKSRKEERKNTNKLVESGNTMLADFYNIFNEDIYEKNDEGNIIFTEKLENGEYKQVPKIDSQKLFTKIQASNQIEKLSAIYDLAVEKGDVEKIEEIKEVLTTHLVKPFIVNDDLGIDVLKQHLEASSELAKISEREKSDNNKFIKSIIEKAEKLKKDYNRFQDFAPSIFKLENENATESDKVDFYNKLSMQYLDIKARQYYTQNKLEEKETTLSELVKERGIDINDLQDNPSAFRDLGTVDSRISKTYKEVGIFKNDLREISEILNSYWDNKSVVDKFNKEINTKIKRQENESKIEKETNKVLDNIKKATTIEELDNVDIPENVPSEILKQNIDDKRKEIQKKISEDSSKISEKSEGFTQEQLQEQLKAEEALKQLTNNYNVGEQVNIPDVNSIPENRRGVSAKITAIEKDYISFETEDGQIFAFKPTTFATAVNTSNFVTEGPVEDTFEKVQEDTSTIVYEEKNQPRIIITDNNKGNKLSFVSDAALEFERTPRNKVGEEKSIEINKGSIQSNYEDFLDIGLTRQLEILKNIEPQKFINNVINWVIEKEEKLPTKKEQDEIADNYNNLLDDLKRAKNIGLTFKSDTYEDIEEITDYIITNIGGVFSAYINEKILNQNNKSYFSDNQKKALELYNNNDFSDIEFLIDNLPLNIKLTDDIVAPLETKSDTSEAYNKIFNKTSRELRTTIIKELAKGTKIGDITVPIAGQGNGTLQLEDNVVENLITGLYEFSGDISKIKKEDIYFVDNFGTLVNVNDNILPANKPLAKGEVYIKIHTAAGLPFPLKLNIKKLTEEKAELLYEIYKNRFDGAENNTLSSLDKDLWNNIQVNFKDVLDLLNKNINDITIKDLIEFLVWEGSKNPKTQVKYTTKNTLLLFDKELTKEQFNTSESKDLFIYTLTQNKRHQIKFKRKEKDSNNLNIDENRAYLEYLITSGTLNTNAKIGEPTFQGKTTIYLAKDQVKVKGKLSEFNEDLVKVYKTKVAKPKPEVKPELPKKQSSSMQLEDKDQVDILNELFGPPSSVKESNKKEPIKKVDLKVETEFSKMSDEKASEVYVKLSSSYKNHLKEIQVVAKKYNKIQDKAEAVFNLLKNKNISEKEIKTKCGL